MRVCMTLTWRVVVGVLVAAGAAHGQGVGNGSPNNTPILIGQSAGFSGGQAEYSADVRLGIEASFAAANRAGGIGGRRVELVTADDGGKRDAVLANTRKLVETDKVLALIGYTSGAGTEVSLDYIRSARVPTLSPATGNMGIRTPFHPYLFHTRAGYADEMAKTVGHVAQLGFSRVALAYLDDVGPANPQSMRDALTANKLQPVALVGLNRNGDDFTPQIETLMAAKADLVVFISNAKPMVKIISGMRERKYFGQFATSSFSGPRAIADLKQHAPGLIVIQVLPQPRQSRLVLHRQFHLDLAQLDPKAVPNYTSLEGYVAARTLLEGLRRAGPAPSRERLAATLSGLGEFDLGGYRVRFDRNNHLGSQFVDLGVVNDRGELRF
jgi:branched-chain amino acid transport system substrate-binding protein